MFNYPFVFLELKNNLKSPASTGDIIVYFFSLFDMIDNNYYQKWLKSNSINKWIGSRDSYNSRQLK